MNNIHIKKEDTGVQIRIFLLKFLSVSAFFNKCLTAHPFRHFSHLPAHQGGVNFLKKKPGGDLCN